jgi:sugar fermentation stimulation protein A
LNRAPFVPFPEPRLRGRFLFREKRFLAHMVLEDGTRTIAHCPNTGSMRSCLEEGAPTILWDSRNPDRRLPLTWKAVRIGNTWIGIDTGVPNRLAAETARSGYIPALAGYPTVKTEQRISAASRIDLLLECPDKGRFYIEVKNVTLVEDGLARFPDAVTERGRKHLEELAEQVGRGHRAAMLYIVQRGDATRFEPADDIDPSYGRALREAVRRGVEAYVLSTRVSPEGVEAGELLPLTL